ncbi:RING finger and transmembrane domain-containing protein 1 [Tetrabaena socialis]|uniref:RING finger and transmembrane domain-containing protein 1 n=1 Tax=Tetrabaena socialis TaxID=47790 RepID=A0A2J7ZW35_9CHLO|nr:RING finger and transmembrane domain-containing protein 1 [Tetrabaena socialis]|eukprot:PNH04474.1 RING finger and transmembrane domain-containing protein 1 [Tetrabaena socialis]
MQPAASHGDWRNWLEALNAQAPQPRGVAAGNRDHARDHARDLDEVALTVGDDASSGPGSEVDPQQQQPLAPRGDTGALWGQLSRRLPPAVAAAAAASLGGAEPAERGDPSVSASAERHRLTSDRTGVNMQVLAEWTSDVVPYALLLACLFFLHHLRSLLLAGWLTSSILRVNADIRRLVALRREAQVRSCLLEAGLVLLLAGISVALTAPDAELVRALALRPVQTHSAAHALILVVLADTLARFVSLAPKLLVVALFRARQPSSTGNFAAARHQRQQSRVLTVLECTAVLYRVVLPTPIWYLYLLKYGGVVERVRVAKYGPAPDDPVAFFASTFAGFYLTLKASAVLSRLRLLWLALRTATRRGALYGTYMRRDEASETGTFGACPVCQDPVTTPVRLDCGHIFCEECILEWLERDRTCPLCRAFVRPGGLPACTDGASPLLPQLF